MILMEFCDNDFRFFKNFMQSRDIKKKYKVPEEYIKLLL